MTPVQGAAVDKMQPTAALGASHSACGTAMGVGQQQMCRDSLAEEARTALRKPEALNPTAREICTCSQHLRMRRRSCGGVSRAIVGRSASIATRFMICGKCMMRTSSHHCAPDGCDWPEQAAAAATKACAALPDADDLGMCRVLFPLKSCMARPECLVDVTATAPSRLLPALTLSEHVAE